MNQFWETAVFDNPYVPMIVYDVSCPGNNPAQNRVSVLTQKNYQEEAKVFSCCSFVHCHSFLELLYIRDNNVKVQLNGNIFYANYGDIIIINGYDIHEIDDLKNHWVFLIDPTKINHLSEAQVSGLFPTCSEDKWLKSSEYKGSDRLNNICQSLVESLKGTNGHGDLKTTACFYELLHEIYVYAKSMEKKNIHSTNELDHKLIYGILKYLEKNYTNEISLQEIADQVGFSKNYFCRYFKNITGKSLMSFVNEMRCQRARDLLENSKLPITQIALDTGFSSTSYFSRKFKAYWGMPPRALRNNSHLTKVY